MEYLLSLGLLAGLAYWCFCHGKRNGSAGGFRAGRRRCRCWRRR